MADRLVPTALVRLREGEPEKAAEIFKAVISVSPAAADAHNNYAFCLLPIDPLHAFEEFEIANELLPNRLVTLANMVLALHLLGRNEEASNIGYSENTANLPAEGGIMWNIDDDHVLQLADWDDVHEYLRSLLTHISKEFST